MFFLNQLKLLTLVMHLRKIDVFAKCGIPMPVAEESNLVPFDLDLHATPSPSFLLSPSKQKQQDSAVPLTINNYSFYAQVLVAIGLGAAILALIILQSVFLKPVLAFTCVIGLGFCFYKKAEIVTAEDSYTEVSLEMERGTENGLL